ncbi:MAG: hypothetical protein ACETV0_05380, partial [Nitrososphaeria archaeon]
EELGAESLIPEKIIEAGRIAGTKGDFAPFWRDGFKTDLKNGVRKIYDLTVLLIEQGLGLMI